LARNNIISVTFAKKNGEERTMKCSLKDEYIIIETGKNSTSAPKISSNSSIYRISIRSVRKQNDDVLPVWDLDNNAWRSFRIDSVKGVKVWEQS
jgi:hypothetical protein